MPLFYFIKLNKNSKKITLSILAVSNSERKKGLARELVLEFEKRCKIKKIKYIELGARFRACSFYEKLSYNYCLMIQVFDFSTIEDVRNKNKYNFEEISSFQGETYGCICFKVPSINGECVAIINWHCSNLAILLISSANAT